MEESTKLIKFIESIAYVGKSDIPGDEGDVYYSKIDNSFLTRVGMEDSLNFLLKKGITEQIQDGYGEPKVSCIGFNTVEQKWYGWSHRAIFGFRIGSLCKIGDCGFNPSNEEEFSESCLNFWADGDYSCGDEKVEIGLGKNYNDEIVNGVYVKYTYNDKVPNTKLRGTEFCHFCPFPQQWGRGEWTALTIADAKQMAIDFAKNVS